MINEKKLQRVLQIMTGIAILLVIAGLVTIFSKKQEEKPFASVLTETKLRKVKRPVQIQELIKTAVPETQPISEQKESAAPAPLQYEPVLSSDNPSDQLKDLISSRKFIDAQNFLNTLPETVEFDFYRGLLLALFNQEEKSKTYLIKVRDANNPEFSEKANIILKAFEEFDFASDGKPEYLQALLAKAFNEIKEYELSIAIGLDAIKTKDDYRDVWVTLGHSYLSQGKFADAEGALEKAVSLDANSKAHFYLSVVKAQLQKYKDALDHLQTAEKLGFVINTLVLKEFKADLYHVSKNYLEAAKLYRQILDEKKESASPEEYIRLIYINLEVFRNTDEGLRLAKQAFSYHKDNAMSYNLLGWAYLAKGNTEAAKINLEYSVSLNPNLSAPYYNLGKLYEYENSTEKAKEYYKKAFEFASSENNQSIMNAALNKINSLTNITQ